MQRRLVFFGIGAALLAAVGTGGIIFYSKKQTPKLVTYPANSISPTPTPSQKLLTWDDPAGFTFQYPEGLAVNKHDEDMENYAHVELTSKDHPGSLIVWAKDTTSGDVVAWVKTEKSFTGASVLDTVMGNQPAKKVTISSPEKLVTGTIFDELLFMVETTPTDKPFWSATHETVAGSFEFKSIPGASDSESSSADSAVDEEEIVQ